MDEFQAEFYGLRRDWQYLSDGGHFENTGIYEMLRTQRRVGFVFATDAGADREYEFEDLAILIQLVRIDFGIELEVDARGIRPCIGVEQRLRNTAGIPRLVYRASGTCAERRLPRSCPRRPILQVRRAAEGLYSRPDSTLLDRSRQARSPH